MEEDDEETDPTYDEAPESQHEESSDPSDEDND